MHVLLTDALTCPHCGPDWPLVLLAEQVEDRRVLAGWLGCANCREKFRVESGFADLRYGEVNEESTAPSVASDQSAMRLAALLGVTEGPALVLLIGSGAVNAAAIAALVPQLEVAAAWQPLSQEPEQPGVSRLAIGATLPLRSASMRGVAITDAAGAALLREAARVAAPRARVVVLSSDARIAEELVSLGLRVQARDENAIVAIRTAL